MSSNIDTKGLVNVLFGNNSIDYYQAISELYHNSDDADSTIFKIYEKNINNTNYLVFEDNGHGMNLEDMISYLNVFNIKNYNDQESHGKYSFGGKQAIFTLCGINNIDKSERAVILSKKNNSDDASVSCEFNINDLLEYGWINRIQAK
jgi:hypothetical protein